VTTSPLFRRVLIANRGEIVGRVASTLRRLEIVSVAIYTAPDRGALHTRVCDQAVAVSNYLDIGALVAAALATDSEAIHPGYGFLSENAEFAEACAAAGLNFIGPRPETIRLMGDKIAAKRTAQAAGVRVVAGGGAPGMSDQQLAALVTELGAPVLLKPAAGGGGKGMHRLDRVDDADQVIAAIGTARREAQVSFGDDTLLVERYVRAPRHVEVQVLGDGNGTVVHLGERDCTLQRRHQKVIEEAPSPLIDADQRAALCAQAVALATACAYRGAGTVEFVVSADDPDHPYFLEMNTRLQVEHPVTEMVTGVDLVEQQLRVAAGQPLSIAQAEVRLEGHAVEARIYAENPARGFLPTGGTVIRCDAPPGARFDSGIAVGSLIGSSYDPMLAKLIVHAVDRRAALAALDDALARTVIHGVVTNVGFLRRLITAPEVLAGRYDTGFIEAHPKLAVVEADSAPADRLGIAAAAIVEQAHANRSGAGVWDRLDGWRHGDPQLVPVLLADAHGNAVVVPAAGSSATNSTNAANAATAAVEGAVTTVTADEVWITLDGQTVTVGRPGRGRRSRKRTSAGNVATSPMPGTVVTVAVQVGQRVVAGDVLAVVEAMKMEHRIVAGIDGTVAAVHVNAGQRVALDDVLVELNAVDASAEPESEKRR